MRSWQSRLASWFVRVRVRRRDWGDSQALARRCRRLFGVPPAVQRMLLRGLSHELVARADGVRGEWIIPPSPQPGVVLYVHGGGYVACSPATHRPVTTALARLTRRAVFSAEYRLAPESRFPAAFDDALMVYRWLIAEGMPAGPIAIAGESAGGGLVLALAQQARDTGLRAPDCIVALSPWTDMTGSGGSRYANDGRCAMFRPGNLDGFVEAYLAGARRDDPRASPLFGSWHGLPPVLLQVGSTELLLDDATRVHARIRAAGGQSRITVYDDVPHGWQLFGRLLPEAEAALQEAADFVRAQFERPHLSGSR